MSLIPFGLGPHQGGRHKWETIRYALDSNGRTARLILIILTMSAASVGLALALALAHGWWVGPRQVACPPGQVLTMSQNSTCSVPVVNAPSRSVPAQPRPGSSVSVVNIAS